MRTRVSFTPTFLAHTAVLAPGDTWDTFFVRLSFKKTINLHNHIMCIRLLTWILANLEYYKSVKFFVNPIFHSLRTSWVNYLSRYLIPLAVGFVFFLPICKSSLYIQDTESFISYVLKIFCPIPSLACHWLGKEVQADPQWTLLLVDNQKFYGFNITSNCLAPNEVDHAELSQSAATVCWTLLRIRKIPRRFPGLCFF